MEKLGKILCFILIPILTWKLLQTISLAKKIKYND